MAYDDERMLVGSKGGCVALQYLDVFCIDIYKRKCFPAVYIVRSD